MNVTADLEAWVALALIPQVGSATQRRLLGAFGGPAAVLGASNAALGRVVGERLAVAIARGADPEAVRASCAWAAAPDHHIVTLGDPAFPQAFLEIPDPPTLLYVIGRLELLQRPCLAIVGSRNPTQQGLINAREFAQAIAQSGLTIASGLALGIDAAAHQGALATDASTIAVLGTGVDIRYPRRNAALYEEIAHRGAVLSEMPLGTAAQPGHFPRRNRLISGIAKGCLVVEAAISSGSLITARLAAEQGREVFAIPGSIHSPLTQGCHALIKQGAKLVESTADVIGELGNLGTVPSERARPAPTAAAGALLRHVGFDPIDLDSLCRRSGLTPDIVSAMLLELELSGHIAALPGGRYVQLG